MVNLLRQLKRKDAKSEILITGNCQTNPISNAFALMVPSIKVHSCWKLGGLDPVIQKINSLGGNLIWATSCTDSEIQVILSGTPKVNIKVLRFPDIYFSSFHPDCMYLSSKHMFIRSFLGDYHSKIIFWSWLNGLDQVTTKALFTPRNFEFLGYMDYWEYSVKALRATFLESDLPESTLDQILESKKKFMHSINHLSPAPMALVANEIAIKLGYSPNIGWQQYSIVAKDEHFHNGPIFPYYPGISDFFGENGSFMGRNTEGEVFNLDSLVDGYFKLYDYYQRDEFDVKTIFTEEFDLSMGLLAR
jgi:hypothetical protein